jgi:hypothetical protein
VDEGILPGYDGRVVYRPYANDYNVELHGGGGACCFASYAEAEAYFPGYNLYLLEP